MCNLSKDKCNGKCKKHNAFKSDEVLNIVQFVADNQKEHNHKCGGCGKCGSHNHSHLTVITEDMIR